MLQIKHCVERKIAGIFARCGFVATALLYVVSVRDTPLSLMYCPLFYAGPVIVCAGRCGLSFIYTVTIFRHLRPNDGLGKSSGLFTFLQYSRSGLH